MPFNAEYTNEITVWRTPTHPPDTSGGEYLLSVAVELPIYFVLPLGVNEFEHSVRLGDAVEKITLFQDCVKFYYGDFFSTDGHLRYKVLRQTEARGQVEAQPPPTGRKYIEKLKSVARITTPIRFQQRDRFVLYQLRPYCERLMQACNRLLEAERSTYFSMAWVYPYSLSFLSVDLYWVSLYQNGRRVEAFPFMGNAHRIALQPPHPAVPGDFTKVQAAAGTEDVFPDWWLYFCKAASHHGQQNYREAVIEAVIALEMALSQFVRKKWKERAVSQNAIDRAKRDVSLSIMINIELVALADPARRPSDQLIGKLNTARKLRNDIVHEGKIDVSELESKECVGVVKQALLLMCPDIYSGSLMASIIAIEQTQGE